jgi:hypothetical protein
VRRSVLWLAIVASVAACENSADPLDGIISGGGGALTQAQAAGNWSFTLQRTTTLPCTTSPLANGTVINTHLDVLADGTLSTATSTWVNPGSGAIQSLSGQVRLSNGITGITFTASGTGGMELQGTMTSAGTFTGTLTDPAAGFSQVFGSGGCEYTASGIKTS